MKSEERRTEGVKNGGSEERRMKNEERSHTNECVTNKYSQLTSLFTFHFSPHTQAHSLGYTFHHIPKLIRLATLFTLHSLTCQHRAICKSRLRENEKALMPIWDNHFSLFTPHSPTCLHRAICKSPLQQNAKALMLIWDNHFLPHTQAHSLGYTFHFSLFTLHSPHSSSSSLEKKSSRSRRSFLVGRPSPFLR